MESHHFVRQQITLWMTNKNIRKKEPNVRPHLNNCTTCGSFCNCTNKIIDYRVFSFRQHFIISISTAWNLYRIQFKIKLCTFDNRRAKGERSNKKLVQIFNWRIYVDFVSIESTRSTAAFKHRPIEIKCIDCACVAFHRWAWVVKMLVIVAALLVVHFGIVGKCSFWYFCSSP